MPELKLQDVIELPITRMGGLGDGIGNYKGHTVFVPYTCAGDEVRAEIISIAKGEIRAKLVGIVRPGDQRQIPPCPHFGECGGCNLQHLRPDDYADFKKEMLAQIIRRLGCDSSVIREMVVVGAGTRRRVELKVSVHKGAVSLGFYATKSHILVDIEYCPVTHADITAQLPALRELVASIKKPGNVKAIHITLVNEGFDMMLSTAVRLTAADKQKIIDFAKERTYLRISEQSADTELQVILTQSRVQTNFAGVDVELPAPAFLQATQKGQVAITEFILKHMHDYKRVMDLYSGCGTYSFPLQQQGHRVSAYEGSYDMVMAMHNAIRSHSLESHINATMRDLLANPVKPSELQQVDAIVINPPRNGAEAQMKELAKSPVRKIVMVSCNPATFERDAKHLLHDGYTLTEAMPIDQFFWSAHLELVAAFEKHPPAS